MADNADSINTNAQNPKRVSADGITADQFPIKDQVEADRYAASKSAMRRSRSLGLRFVRFSSPGSQG